MALFMKDCIVSVDGDDYAAQISGVRFVPSSAQASWVGLTPDSAKSETGIPTWLCTIPYVQDWEETDSFARYLFGHIGETKTMVFTPLKGTGNTTFTADVSITSGDIGGDVNSYATTSVSLGSTKPVLGTVA